MGANLVRFYGFDMLVHRWDVAQAAGVDAGLTADELDRIERGADGFGDALYLDGVCRPGVEAPADADREARVLARLGRTARDLTGQSPPPPPLAAGQQGPDGVDRVGVGGGLVRAVAQHAGEPQRDPAGVAGAPLHAVERDLDDELRPQQDTPVRALPGVVGEGPRLPVQQLVGHALERLADHDRLATVGVAGAEVDVGELACAASVAPLRADHDEIQREHRLDLLPRLAAPAGGVGARRAT